MQHETLSDGVVVGGDITFWSILEYCLMDFCKVSARASYEIMSRSFCCLRETETTDESRCDFNVDVVRGFWRRWQRRWQRPGRAATEQTDRLFSISLHGQHTLCRCFLSLQAHTHKHTHTHSPDTDAWRGAQVSQVLDLDLFLPLSRSSSAQQARTFIQGEHAGAGISLALERTPPAQQQNRYRYTDYGIPMQIPSVRLALFRTKYKIQNTNKKKIVLNASNTRAAIEHGSVKLQHHFFVIFPVDSSNKFRIRASQAQPKRSPGHLFSILLTRFGSPSPVSPHLCWPGSLASPPSLLARSLAWGM